MQITVRPGFLLAAAGMAALDRWGVVPPFALAAALHEAGHLTALWALGLPVYAIELSAGGAVIRTELRGAPGELWALAAGPGVNLLLAALSARLWPLFGLCNLSLAVWNLLPLPGRDGRALLRAAKENRKK